MKLKLGEPNLSFNNSVDLTKAHVNKVNAKKTRDIQDFAQYKATLNEEAVDMKFHMKFDATLFLFLRALTIIATLKCGCTNVVFVWIRFCVI